MLHKILHISTVVENNVQQMSAFSIEEIRNFIQILYDSRIFLGRIFLD